jgi:hypothetical protein
MKRAEFASLLVAGATAVPIWALARRLEGTTTTQPELFAALPRIAAGQWTRIILGSGAEYQKQIGAGIETDATGKTRHFLELQVGSPGGSCNPNSMRKAYLRANRFGSLFDRYPLVANVGQIENLFYRYGDVRDGAHGPKADATLRLLDMSYLYDSRPMRIISVAPQTIHSANRNITATHVVAEFNAASGGRPYRMRRMELWHHPAFPFGVVRYRATLTELEPFNAHVYSFGERFASLLPLSLDRVRAMTPNGQYGQLQRGIGSS